jgi:hypothetical protein
VEVEGGLKAAALAIYLPEVAQPLGQNATLADCGLPSGVLIALTLHKISIADMQYQQWLLQLPLLERQ